VTSSTAQGHSQSSGTNVPYYAASQAQTFNSHAVITSPIKATILGKASSIVSKQSLAKLLMLISEIYKT